MFLSKKRLFSTAKKTKDEKRVDENLLINLLMNWELNDEYEEIQSEIQVRKLRNGWISINCASIIRYSAKRVKDEPFTKGFSEQKA